MTTPMRSGWLPFAAVLAALLATLPAAPAPGQATAQEGAQQEQDDDWQPLESFDEAISVEVTSIEVWVTDRQGNPVTDLSAGDFVLTEDGELVTITNFASYGAEEQGSWAAPAETGQAPEPPTAAEAQAPEEAPAAEGRDPVLAADPSAPTPDVDPDVDPESRLHLAILIDNWNLRPADRSRVFQDLREFLRERMAPGDEAMVIAHDRSLALIQEPTRDTDDLLAALARVERSGMTNVQLQNARRSAYQNIRDAYENAILVPDVNAASIPDPCDLSWPDMQNHAREYATTILSHTQRSGGALASAGQILAGLPGRKILLYVGSGLPQQAGSEVFHYLSEICPHKQQEIASWYSQFDLSWLYEEVARQANANGLTLYTIEASAPQAADDLSVGGLAAPTTPTGGGRSGQGGSGQEAPRAGGPVSVTSSGQTFRPSAAARRSADLDQEAGLFYVANETGGRAILNAADFARDFERLATELRTYYSLGFAPRHGGDGQLHSLEVRLKPGVGDGYRVRHRQSYRDKPYEVRMAEKIRGVAQFGTEANRMKVRVETGEATATGAGWRVPIRLWVPLDEMTLAEPPSGDADGRAGRLRVMMAVSDAAGNLGPVRQKLVTVEVGEDGEGATTGREHLVEVDLDLPTADHVVALGLRDELGGETSFVRHVIHLGNGEPAGGTADGER
jgi:VWFA-related protein